MTDDRWWEDYPTKNEIMAMSQGEVDGLAAFWNWCSLLEEFREELDEL